MPAFLNQRCFFAGRIFYAMPWKTFGIAALMSCLLSGCFKPPYNEFRGPKQSAGEVVAGAGLGAGAGAIIAGGTGAGIGGIAGGFLAAQGSSKKALVKTLQQHDIEFIPSGNLSTLLIPTDRYYLFNSPRLNDIEYPGLMNIVKLLKQYPTSTIHVAAFTDDVGTMRHKNKLTQARADEMLTFLWAQGIEAKHLRAQGYADHYAIGDNQLIHGSAFNRRIEIQWENNPTPPQKMVMAPTHLGMTK